MEKEFEEYNHLTPYTIGYRDGIFYTLNELINGFENKKEDLKDMYLFIKAAIHDIDVFANYGSSSKCVFVEWDRKDKKDGTLKSSIPAKVKIYPPNEPMIRTAKGLRSKEEIINLILETIDLICKEKEEKYKALERTLSKQGHLNEKDTDTI